MLIGYDVTALSASQSGVGTYTRNLLTHLSVQAGDIDQIFALTHQSEVTAPPSKRWHINKTVWMQCILPWQLRALRADICHFTNNVASLVTPCPSIVTIHDMSLWMFPQFHYRRRLLAMR